MKTENRIFYYDFLRAFAIIAIILCHVDGMIGYSFRSLKLALPGLFTTVALTGVPLFFMLSGALLLNKNYSLEEFYKKRFTRIIYPFLLWIVITSIIGVVFLNWTDTEILNFIFGINTPTWYIWSLIGIYLLMPMINAYLKEYDLKGLEIFLIIWVITLLFNSYEPLLLKPLELRYFSGYVGYVALGYYLDNKQFKLSDKTILYSNIAVFAVSTLIHMINMYYQLNLYTEYYQNIIIATQAASLFLMIKYWDKCSLNPKSIYNRIKSNFIGKMIVSISICSYGMFLGHYIILQCIKPLNIHSLKLLPVILVIVVFLSWIITYAFSKIPYLKRISGAN